MQENGQCKNDGEENHRTDSRTSNLFDIPLTSAGST